MVDAPERKVVPSLLMEPHVPCACSSKCRSLELEQEIRRLHSELAQTRHKALEEAAAAAFENLDDPFLSGHGYASSTEAVIRALIEKEA